MLGFINPVMIRPPPIVGGLVGTPSEFKILSGKVSADLTGFPVFINLKDFGSSFWSNVASDGSDIRIYNASDVALPFDLVYWDYATQNGEIYFKADLLTGSDNVFRLFASTGLTAPAVGDPLGRNAVWTFATHVFSGWQNADRTGASPTVTVVGSGFNGGGMGFDGVNDYIRITDTAATQWSAFSFGRINTASSGSVNNAVMSFGPWQTANTNRVTIARRTTDKWGAWNTTNSWIEGAASVNDYDMFTLGYVHNNGTARTLYNLGASIATQAAAAALPSGTTEILLGNEDQTIGEDFHGDIFLFYKTHTLLTAAWMAAQDKNLRTPRLFYTVTGLTLPDANTLFLCLFDTPIPRNLLNGTPGGRTIGTVTIDPANSQAILNSGAIVWGPAPEWDMTSDWTLEWFGNATAADTGGSFFRATSGNERYGVYHNGGGSMDFYNRNAVAVSISGANGSNGSQHHWAIVRDGGIFRAYRDGIQVATSGALSTSTASTSIPFYMGTDPFSIAARYIVMDLKRFKVSNNCRYPSGTTFTPPAVTDL